MEIHHTTRLGHAGKQGTPAAKPYLRQVVTNSHDEKRLINAARNLLMRIGS
jgi:hypothetical protein